MRHRSLMRMLCNPARSPLRASNRFPGGTFSSSSVVTESIWTSLRTATRAIEFQRRLIPVSKSALVCFSAKLLITPFSLYNEFRYTASVMTRPPAPSPKPVSRIAPVRRLDRWTSIFLPTPFSYMCPSAPSSWKKGVCSDRPADNDTGLGRADSRYETTRNRSTSPSLHAHDA